MGIKKEVNFLFVSDREIRRYNRDYLRHDRPTDVIAFEGGWETFGDILISSDRAACQAREEGHSFEKELLILMIHGLLHLCGWRDKRKKEASRMWKKTEELLRKVHR